MRRRWPTPVGWLLLGITVLGLALRLARAFAPTAWIEGDEAVAALMAERISAGRHLYTFMAGQMYMGPLEQYVQAALLRGFSPSVDVLRSVPVIFGAALIPVIYLVGRRVSGSSWWGLMASAVFALGPYYLVWKSGFTHPTYSSAMLFETLTLLAALSFADARRPRAHAALIGFLAGFSIWLNPQTVAFLLPILLWVAADVRRTYRVTLAPLAAGFVVGLAPILLWIARYRMLPRLNPQGHPGLLLRLRGLYDPVIGEFLGVRGLYDTPLFSGSRIVATLITLLAIAVLAIATIARRKGLWALVRLDSASRQPRDLVLAIFLVWPLFYLVAGYTWFTGEPRYLYMLYPLLAVGLATLLASARPGRVTAGLACVLVVAIGLSTLTQLRDFWRYAGPGPNPKAVRAAARVFEASGQRYVYGEYWAAWPLQLAAGDKLVVEAFASSDFPANAVAVAAAAHPAFVALPGSEQQALEARFSALHVHYRRVDVGGMIAYVNVTPRVEPWTLGLAPAAAAVAGS